MSIHASTVRVPAVAGTGRLAAFTETLIVNRCQPAHGVWSKLPVTVSSIYRTLIMVYDGQSMKELKAYVSVFLSNGAQYPRM